jgi:hypothetical protein
MHGMVNRALQGFIVANCGPDVWDEVRSIARLPEDGFEAMHTYDHALTLACFGAAVDVLDKHPNTLLEDIGTYLVTDPRWSRCAACCGSAATRSRNSSSRWRNCPIARASRCRNWKCRKSPSRPRAAAGSGSPRAGRCRGSRRF